MYLSISLCFLHLGKVWTCEECKVEYASKTTLQDHIKVVHEGAFFDHPFFLPQPRAVTLSWPCMSFRVPSKLCTTSFAVYNLFRKRTMNVCEHDVCVSDQVSAIIIFPSTGSCSCLMFLPVLDVVFVISQRIFSSCRVCDPYFKLLWSKENTDTVDGPLYY